MAGIKNTVVLILAFAYFVEVSCAQELMRYNVTDGLPHQQVTTLYQDSKGYLWIGTWDGVSRFDGHSFTSWRHDSNDSTTIFSDEVKHITEDSTHTIWVTTIKGPAKFNSHYQNFERVYLKESDAKDYDGISDNPIAFDRNNRGWFLDRDGLIGFNTDLTSMKHYDVSSFYTASGVIFPDSSGLWMGVKEGVFHYTFENLEESVKLNDQLADQAFHLYDSTFDAIKGGFLPGTYECWLFNCNNMKLYFSDPNSELMQEMSLHFHNQEPLFECFGDIYEMSPGRICFCTDDKGIHIFNRKTRKFEFGRPLQDIVGEQTVYTIFEDRQDNYWVGTQNGLIKYSPPQLNFDAWLYRPDSTNSLSGQFVSSIYLDDDNSLWAACRGGGLDRIDLQSNQITNINLDAVADKVGGVSNVRYVYGLNEELLIMEINSILVSYNKTSGIPQFLSDNPGHTHQIYKDHKKRLWFAGGYSTFVATMHNGTIQISDTVLYKYHRCRDIIETRNNEMYFATNKGLIKLDSTAPGLLKIFLPPGSEMDPEILCIHENSDGTLWVGSIRNGIYLFDPVKEEFIKHLTTEDGLIDNSVNAFMEDEHGNLWLSTWKGIVRFDPAREQFRNYGEINGLPVYDFTTGAYLQDGEGRIYFGGMGGVIRFHPDSFVRFMPGCHLQITAINSNNQRLPFNYPLGTDEVVTLNYDQNDFSLGFSSFDFRNPGQRVYRYKLNGFENDWNRSKPNDYTARYSGISSGIYAFELQSTYQGWPWIGEKTRLMIRVKPPPVFQRKSFQTGILVTLGLALITIVYLRMRYLNMRKEVMISRLEKDANQSRLNFLKSQMNPHFYFNTLNAINSFVLKNEIREANRFLTTFARLMRQILENSQKEFVAIGEEKEVLEKYLSLQQLRFPDVFDYSVVAEKEVLDKLIPPMFLQPFVENAIEYAFQKSVAKGNLQVIFRSAGEDILCVVRDDGIGIEKSMEIKEKRKRKSTAIKNIYKRIEMLNHIYGIFIKLEIMPARPENKSFPGTLITLVIPDFKKLIK